MTRSESAVRHPFGVALIFSLIAVLGQEALHVPLAHHDEHGNRRERLEELRRRLEECQNHDRLKRSIMTLT